MLKKRETIGQVTQANGSHSHVRGPRLLLVHSRLPRPLRASIASACLDSDVQTVNSDVGLHSFSKLGLALFRTLGSSSLTFLNTVEHHGGRRARTSRGNDPQKTGAIHRIDLQVSRPVQRYTRPDL